MTRDEIYERAAALCLAYRREFTEPLANLMVEDYGTWSPAVFDHCVRAHRQDPDRGRYFPTLADLLYQLGGGRDQAKVEAAAAFDANPCIDGTSRFDADHEKYDQRDRRKRAYVARAAFDFEALTAGGQLHSPAQLPPRLLEALSTDEEDPTS